MQNVFSLPGGELEVARRVARPAAGDQTAADLSVHRADKGARAVVVLRLADVLDRELDADDPHARVGPVGEKRILDLPDRHRDPVARLALDRPAHLAVVRGRTGAGDNCEDRRRRAQQCRRPPRKPAPVRTLHLALLIRIDPSTLCDPEGRANGTAASRSSSERSGPSLRLVDRTSENQPRAFAVSTAESTGRPGRRQGPAPLA
jgi:hypothetical protein